MVIPLLAAVGPSPSREKTNRESGQPVDAAGECAEVEFPSACPGVPQAEGLILAGGAPRGCPSLPAAPGVAAPIQPPPGPPAPTHTLTQQVRLGAPARGARGTGWPCAGFLIKVVLNLNGE